MDDATTAQPDPPPAARAAPAEPARDGPARDGHPRPPRRRRRRWLLRGAIALAALLLLAAAAVQAVLWTNIPRDLVLAQLERQLGLRVGAAALTTGWSGDTRLRDVAIALPLSDEALLRVPAMRVKHTSLLGLLWTRAVAVDAIELERPTLLVRQDRAGRWNLQEVADLLARTGGKEAAADQAKKTTRPELPAVRVTDGTVVVTDRGGRSTTVQPLNVEGEPEHALAWRYDVSIGHARPPAATSAAAATSAPVAAPTTAAAATAGPAPAAEPGPPGIRITGRLAPGGAWEHEVHLWAARVEQWAKPWAGERPAGVSLAGEWRGEVKAGGGVAGRLALAGLDVAGVRASGTMTIANEAGRVAVRPEDLFVQTPHPAMPEFRLTAGHVALDGTSATARGLTVLAFGGVALVDADYDWADGSADLKSEWTDFALPGETLSQRGTLTANMRHPFPGKPVVEARLVSNGSASFGAWEADVALGASGQGWSNMDWQLRADRLALPGERPIRLDGLAATVETRGPLVTLASLRGPGDVGAKGHGQYNLADHSWDLRLDLSNLPRPASFGREGPLAVSLAARGTAEHVRLEDPGLSVRGAEAELRAEGWYVYDRPSPLDVNVYVSHVPPRVVSTDDPPIFGYLRGEAHLSGTLFAPRDITIKGKLLGRDVRFIDRPIGDITAAISGRIDDERGTLRTARMDLLGGQWQVDALFPENGVLGLHVTIEGLPLAEVAASLKQPGVEGLIDARWAITVPRLEAEAVRVTADLKARDVKFAALRADTAEASLVLADGTLRAEPVRLRKGDGTAELAAEMDVRQFRRLGARLALAGWPFEPSPGTRAELWGGTTGLRVTLPGGTAPDGRPVKLQVAGPVDVQAFLTLADQPLGDARLLADLRGRLFDLRSVSFDGLDGSVQGQALVDLDRPFDTRGSLFWEDVDIGRIPEFFPDNETLVGLAGRVSGNARVAPAAGPHPIEPLHVRASLEPHDLHYRSVPFGPMRLNAFTNLDRVVIEDSLRHPTTVDMAGGLLRIWGRLSTLEPGQEIKPEPGRQTLLLSQLQVAFERLELDQIVHAFAPEADPMPGKLAGSFTAIAGTRPRRREGQKPSGQGALEKVVRRITADGRIEVTETNLLEFDAVRVFYQALSFVPPSDKPDGRGDVSFHLEDGLLSLNNAKYFNRGLEIHAIADMEEVWRMPDSPLSGTAVGNVRPFRDFKLPVFSAFDVDKVFTALQGDMAAFRLAGTVRDPKLISLALAEIGEGLRMLTGGGGGTAKEKRGNKPAAPMRK